LRKRVSLKRLSVDTIKKLLQLIEKHIESSQTKRKRGRPKIYSDSFILLIYFIKVLRNYSFRDTVFYLKEILGEKMPAISTLHYRFNKIEMSYFEELFEEVLKIMGIDEGEEIEFMVVDGTGFGYDDKQRLNWMRGKKVREVSSHVRVEMMVGRIKGKRDVIIGVEMGKAYTDERKLLKEMMKGIKVKGRYILGDALYGMDVEVLRLMFEKAREVIVPVRDGLHKRVRNPLRKIVKWMYENGREKYKDRYVVEQVIGKIKNAYGQWESVKGLEMAKKEVWVKVIAYNWAQAIIFFVFVAGYMRHLSSFSPYLLRDFSNTLRIE